ncbi:type IV pilus modification PilV family protein [Peribacillus deserti]|uniref:Prepilin-type cleavage/methylation domain-containing protein n=1 Tax=Peribacillus deserti TaxID=673318 RepID=A0A2N5M725_9BACI|nr:type II secretion system protein [Peribacillus deserti]PLT30157.1 hypothetical protein CUU66_08940 [Peribacillus deserti]
MKILNKSDGFSLLEVLIAITILGIFLLSIMGFFNQAYDYTKRNESKTVGINVARNVLNYIERQDYEAVKKTYFPAKSTASVQLTLQNCLEDTKVFQGSCQSIFQSKVNNVTYEAKVILNKPLFEKNSENEPDPNYFYMPVEVEVTWGGHQTSVRGVLKND